ncbi:MAG: YqjF family protein [Gemmatimonadota bacterium]
MTALERPFLTAEWRSLAMLNFEIAPEVLAPYVPRGTALDTWNGGALISMVGFLFRHTRVRGIPIPFHRHFEEVNLRFYVRREGPEGWRRGVVFIRELVPRRAIAWVARTRYQEPYRALPMRHRIAMDQAEAGASGAVAYQWRHNGRWEGLSAETAGRPILPAPDSEAAFITEHYWGYTALRDGCTAEYQVTHPPWAVWPARQATLDCDVAGLYGAAFVPALRAPPRSAFVAAGSAVMVSAGHQLGDPVTTG